MKIQFVVNYCISYYFKHLLWIIYFETFCSYSYTTKSLSRSARSFITRNNFLFLIEENQFRIIRVNIDRIISLVIICSKLKALTNWINYEHKHMGLKICKHSPSLFCCKTSTKAAVLYWTNIGFKLFPFHVCISLSTPIAFAL